MNPYEIRILVNGLHIVLPRDLTDKTANLPRISCANYRASKNLLYVTKISHKQLITFIILSIQISEPLCSRGNDNIIHGRAATRGEFQNLSPNARLYVINC